jgi:hypothetical protein
MRAMAVWVNRLCLFIERRIKAKKERAGISAGPLKQNEPGLRASDPSADGEQENCAGNREHDWRSLRNNLNIVEENSRSVIDRDRVGNSDTEGVTARRQTNERKAQCLITGMEYKRRLVAYIERAEV